MGGKTINPRGRLYYCPSCGEKLNRATYGTAVCEDCWDKEDL